MVIPPQPGDKESTQPCSCFITITKLFMDALPSNSAATHPWFSSFFYSSLIPSSSDLHIHTPCVLVSDSLPWSTGHEAPVREERLAARTTSRSSQVRDRASSLDLKFSPSASTGKVVIERLKIQNDYTFSSTPYGK